MASHARTAERVAPRNGHIYVGCSLAAGLAHHREMGAAAVGSPRSPAEPIPRAPLAETERDAGRLQRARAGQSRDAGSGCGTTHEQWLQLQCHEHWQSSTDWDARVVRRVGEAEKENLPPRTPVHEDAQKPERDADADTPRRTLTAEERTLSCELETPTPARPPKPSRTPPSRDSPLVERLRELLLEKKEAAEQEANDGGCDEAGDGRAFDSIYAATWKVLALEQENCALRRTSSQMVSDTQTTSQRRAPHAKQQIAKELESENLGAKAKMLAAENERLRCEVRAVLSNCVNQVVVGKGAPKHVAD